MESTENLPIDDEGGLLDMADLDSDLVAPEGWNFEEDELPFDASDKDDDSDG
jgi:hypothetical protein